VKESCSIALAVLFDIPCGRAFLIKKQRDNGSWPMTSRPVKTEGQGSTSLIPITGRGSAWAVSWLVGRQNVSITAE
jgi:hypothetical protein